MNTLKIITISFFWLALLSCKEENNTTVIQKNENKFLITEKGVLGLNIGDSMPDRLDNYKLKKSVKIVEEGNEEPIINLIENNVELLQISFIYDSEKAHFTNEVGEILIKNKRFRTEENIGVESTISDFIQTYSSFYIWYTYISGMYVIQSNDKKIQFILDENGYIGKHDLMESDMIKLKKEDFLPTTEITKIRIY